jgi:transposase-like protein
MKRKVKRFPDELAQKIATEYLTTDISQSELKAKYGFTGTANIYRWIAKFGLSKPSETEIKLQNAMGKEKGKTPGELKLEAEILALKKELEHERLRTKALSTLIDVAERDLDISIRKKPGARQ